MFKLDREKQWQGVEHDMELSRTATRLFFIAAFNIAVALFNAFIENWLNLVLTLMNFFIILHSFAMVENAIDEMRYYPKMEDKQ